MFGHWEQIKEWVNLITLWYFSQRKKRRNWWGLEIPILHQDEKSEAISRYSKNKKNALPGEDFLFLAAPYWWVKAVVDRPCSELQKCDFDWPEHTTPWHLTSDSVKPNIISFYYSRFDLSQLGKHRYKHKWWLYSCVPRSSHVNEPACVIARSWHRQGKHCINRSCCYLYVSYCDMSRWPLWRRPVVHPLSSQ